MQNDKQSQQLCHDGQTGRGGQKILVKLENVQVVSLSESSGFTIQNIVHSAVDCSLEVSLSLLLAFAKMFVHSLLHLHPARIFTNLSLAACNLQHIDPHAAQHGCPNIHWKLSPSDSKHRLRAFYLCSEGLAEFRYLLGITGFAFNPCREATIQGADLLRQSICTRLCSETSK